MAVTAGPALAVEGNVVLSNTKLTPPGALWSGAAIAVGNLNGSGGPDIAVGEDRAGGVVHIVFLDQQGLLVSSTQIPGTAPFTGGSFGRALAFLGEIGGKKLLAIGAPSATGAGAFQSGVVWIVELNSSGAVVGTPLRISPGENGLPAGLLDTDDKFGFALAAADLNGDGRSELIVGANLDDDGTANTGAVYILYLTATGTVQQTTKIADGVGGLDGAALAGNERFGSAIAVIDDQDGDGPDLAVSAPNTGTGKVFLLFLNAACGSLTPTACAVKSGSNGYHQIAHGVGGFPIQEFGAPVHFGYSLAWLPAQVGSLANDRLAVGDELFQSSYKGAVWLFEVVAGQPGAVKRISSQTNWSVALDDFDYFGSAVASLGDLNGDTATDLAIGAIGDDDAASNAGTAYFAHLSPCATIITAPKVFHDPTDQGRDPCGAVQLSASPTLHLYVQSGGAVSGSNACTGNTPASGDEMCAWDLRLSVEAPLYIQGFTPVPALAGQLRWSNLSGTPHELRVNWINPSVPQNGVIKIGDVPIATPGPGGKVSVAGGSAAVGADLKLQTIAVRTLGLPEPAQVLGLFAGIALLAALARRRARTATSSLAVLLAACLTAAEPARAQTSIRDQVRINWLNLNVPTNPPWIKGELGAAIAPVGDLDGDGTLDVASSNNGSCFISANRRIFALFLDRDTQLLGYREAVRGPCGDTYDEQLNPSLATQVPDLDGNGILELLVGRPFFDDTTASDQNQGRVMIAFLTVGGPNGGLEAAPRVAIGNGVGGLPAGSLAPGDNFGWAMAWLGDIDDNGTQEIAVGAPRANAPGGKVWLLSLSAGYQVVAYRVIDLPSLGEPAASNQVLFGYSLSAVGDLDRDGYHDVVVGAPGQTPPGVGFTGSLYVLFLEPGAGGAVQVKSKRRISPGEAGLDLGVGAHNLQLGRSLAWLGLRDPERLGGGRELQGGGVVVAVGNSGVPSLSTSAGAVYMMHLKTDGTVSRAYRIAADEGHGAVISATDDKPFGSALAAPGDLDGDEVGDLAVGASSATNPGQTWSGEVLLFFLKDADHDGLDDVLDNCPFVHNPQQADADGDDVGDLCDNCPALANADQADVDSDGEGNLCEPVEVQLTATGTPAAPSWSLSLECGTRNVTQVNGAIVLPAGATNPKTLALNGPSIGGGSGTSGPGLPSPQRSDAIYFTAAGNGAGGRLCTALDPSTYLGTLTTGPIGGTQLAAAALTSEGIATLVQSTSGTVPLAGVRLVNGEPLPILKLELGPAVFTGSGTRWDVIAKNASAEFHRVTFGLIAPAGTTTAQMRWVGCSSLPSGPADQRSCSTVPGFGTTTSAANSFTEGPQPSPPGTRLPHTLYVSLVGNRPSQSSQLTFNPVNGPAQVTLGTVELDASPDLEPAITVDGVESVTTNPLQKADAGVPSPTQLRLIGAFDPAEDLDGDEIQDLSDDCPFAYDPAQENRGSFGSDEDDSDALGDACQCGESTGDGAVLNPPDYELIRDYLTGLVTNPVVAAEIAARCSVAGPTDCNIRDLVVLKMALDAGAPSVATKCDAALSPATP